MKKLILLFLVFVISNCTTFQSEATNLIFPKLLRQSDLPAVRESISDLNFDFYCEMHINTNGNVERAKMLAGSGDAVWDSLAELSFLQWKYSPAIYDGHPVNIVIRRKIKVVFIEPKILLLAEIQLDNLTLADSIYNALLSGADFTSLAVKYSTSSSRDKNGLLGSVNIQHFTEGINQVLKRLADGEFTKPLNYGKHYVIFKRLKHNNY